MHETLIQEWRRAMATRAAIATLLFVIPAFVAAYVQLGGSVSGLPTGLASLAGGPSAQSVDSGPAATLSDAVDGIVDLVSGSGGEGKAGRDSSGPQSGGQGGGGTPTDPGTTPPPPSNPPSGGDTTGQLGPLLQSLNGLGLPALQGGQ